MADRRDFVPTCKKCGDSKPTTQIFFKEVSKQAVSKAYICQSCERVMPQIRNSLELRGWLGKKE